MNHKFLAQSPVNLECSQKTELDLEEILAEVWTEGSPNGIINTL
ncbi:MAG: hypothetical protein AAFQ80_23140 [Cyanobacteria bacterium J06621_8]